MRPILALLIDTDLLTHRAVISVFSQPSAADYFGVDNQIIGLLQPSFGTDINNSANEISPKDSSPSVIQQGYFGERYNLSWAMVEGSLHTATALHRLFPCASPH